jgi:hypothetical protein
MTVNPPYAAESESAPRLVNGKHYPMWSQFADRAAEWIGGTLEDFGDHMDRALGGATHMTTRIIGIVLEPNGTDSACFRVQGEDFDCAFDVRYGGIVGGETGWMTFSGYGGHTWRIQQPLVKAA